MRKTLFIILITAQAHSQGIDNLWLMGTTMSGGGVNLDFTGSILHISQDTNRVMNFQDDNGVICDKYGNLLFYTNGVYIANAIDSVMVNGGGLNPSNYTSTHSGFGLTMPQGALIIPFPNDTTKYYLFHLTSDDYGHTNCALHLYYSIIDMTLDSGRGAVIQKNAVLLNDSLVCGLVTACKHANGRDWWLVFHQNNSDQFYKYLIMPDTIQGPFIQNIGAIRIEGLGQAVFSPDGNKFAYYLPDFYPPYGGIVDIFNFDRCTGNFSNPISAIFNDTANLGGVAFSPNSKVLYVSSLNYVYQFDMTAANIAASKLTVAVWDSFYSPSYPLATNFYLSQLAPDGKIYIVCGNGTWDIHVINNPDSLGLSCNLCQHCIHLPAENGFTIANHPNYFLEWEQGSLCDSLPHVGVDELAKQNNQLKIYPNPVSSNGEVTFNYPSTGDEKAICVYNVDGKEVVRYGLPQWSTVLKVRLSQLAKAIYVARLVSKGKEANVKFIVE